MKLKQIRGILLGGLILILASCSSGSNTSNTGSTTAPGIESTPGSDSKPGEGSTEGSDSITPNTPEVVEGRVNINIKPTRHEYLKDEELALELSLSSDKGIIKNSSIEYSLFNKANKLYSASSKSDNNGLINLNIELNNLKLNNDRYLLEIISKDYDALPLYFSFDIKDKVNDKALSYDSLKENGYFNNILGKEGFSEDFIKANTLKGLGGFSVLDINSNEVKIDDIAKMKPTVLVFSTPGCAACKMGMRHLANLDSSDINILFITSDIGNEDLDLAREEARAKASEFGISDDSLYFDTISDIWGEVLNYSFAPQMVFLNSYSEPIGFMSSYDGNYDSFNSFKEEFNYVLNKAYGLTLNERVELVELRIHYFDHTEVISVKKGEKIEISVPPIKNHRFMGFKVNGEFIDLAEYIINKDLDIYLDYMLVGVMLSDVADLDKALIDLRGKEEFNKGHLKDAYSSPANDFTNIFLNLNIDNKKTIILYGVDKPYEIMDYLSYHGYKSYYLIDYEIKPDEEIKYLSYEERRANGELDSYFDPHKESEILKKHYGKSYLDLSFTGFDKLSHSLSEYIYLEDKPTIIMVGSTTCPTCDYALERFFEMEGSRDFNFIEAISFSRKQDLNSLIDNQINKIDSNMLAMHKKYRFFDNNRYTQENEYLYAHELPIFYILDREGNLSNLVSSFNKALDYLDRLGNSISVRNHEDNPNKELKDRISNNEFKHIEGNTEIYSMLEKNYASFMLKKSFYDYSHSVRSLNYFLDYNSLDKAKPTALFIMNSKNSDFNDSIILLDSLMKRTDINLLIIVDNNSYRHTELIMKPYSSKIMFDDYNTVVGESLLLYKSSYFVILDSNGNLSNALVDPSDLDMVYKGVSGTISVKSPNKLTKPSVIKPGDNVLSKDSAFKDKGFLSHLDSSKDMARYEYLNLNYGRNYLDFEVIGKNGENISLKNIVDPNKETIVCFLQSYMDDFYYAFNPLYKLKDECNIVIVFTNRRDEPYNEAFVDSMLELGTKKAIAKAKEPQNIGSIIDIVKGENPNLENDELDKAVDLYLANKYDYKKLKDYIYGSYAYLTTPLLDTEVRGIQLYLDKNGNLASISQTYYAVGGVFETVLNKIKGYIAKED